MCGDSKKEKYELYFSAEVVLRTAEATQLPDGEGDLRADAV